MRDPRRPRFHRLAAAVMLACCAAARADVQKTMDVLQRAGTRWARLLHEKPGPVDLTLSGHVQIGRKRRELYVRLKCDGQGQLAAAVRSGKTDVRVLMDAAATRLVVVRKKVVFEGRGARAQQHRQPLFALLTRLRQGLPPAAAAFVHTPAQAGQALAMLGLPQATFVGEEQVEGVASAHLRTRAGAGIGRADLWLDGARPLHVKWTSQNGRDAADLWLRRGGQDVAVPKGYKVISVPREELDRTLIRGLARAANILLERVTPPADAPLEAEAEGGRLIRVSGKRVALLRGSHRQMGRQHGLLLKPQAEALFDTILHAIGLYASIDTGAWFADSLREARRRTWPYTPQCYKDEMAGLAEAAKLPLEEVELGTMFPEYFHCSGFAVWGKATKGGVLYHGRVLDYMREIGLQQRAVLFVCKPDQGHAFVNAGYAGYIGSGTGMNARQVAVGEMGGGGVGHWDGLSMGLLVRKVLEQAGTLDEAVAIFRDTPRTCEYYYVVSDGKIPSARGLATSWKSFEVVMPNQAHKLLPHPVKDAVLLSSGRRYESLVANVKAAYGKIDAAGACALVDKNVAIPNGNLHNVIFAPQTLELWVTDATATQPAFKQPYAHVKVGELLEMMR